MSSKMDSGFRRRLTDALSEFDGKATEGFEGLLLELEESPEAAELLLELMSSRDESRAIGASWLLKALLEGGWQLDRKEVSMLARSLERLQGDWVALHVCQSMRFFEVPGRNGDQFARFLDRCVVSDQKFLRAWAIDGFWRLAGCHDAYLPRAHQLIQQGAEDPAASVRARVRNLRKEMGR